VQIKEPNYVTDSMGCCLWYKCIIITVLQNAFDHAKAKKDGVILPNKG
jgi:hypothetical protein